MQITPAQHDALSELVNIGFGRAAAALSRLVGRRVVLDAPDVRVLTLEELGERLAGLAQGEVATVHQFFGGAVSGDALLMMDHSGAGTLIDMIDGRPVDASQSRGLTSEDREALSEIGNILLNAYVGSFGNLLKVHITFTVPRLRLESVDDVLYMLTVANTDLRYALLVKTEFKLTEGRVGGYVAVVMGVRSLERLFEAMEQAGLIYG